MSRFVQPSYPTSLYVLYIRQMFSFATFLSIDVFYKKKI